MMTNKSILLTDALYGYLLMVSSRETDLMRRLRDETARDAMARMQIAPEQGQFMALLIELSGACKAIEIGVYTGYSALCVAQALPDDGTLVACDINPEWTAMARRYWAEAGVEHKIDLRLAPALDTLRTFIADDAGGSFDFAFIDADKENIGDYYELCLQLLRPGGLMIIDNALWGGSVADANAQDPETRAIQALNLRLRDDRRISLSLLPIADGLSLALKKLNDPRQSRGLIR